MKIVIDTLVKTLVSALLSGTVWVDIYTQSVRIVSGVENNTLCCTILKQAINNPGIINFFCIFPVTLLYRSFVYNEPPL